MKENFSNLNIDRSEKNRFIQNIINNYDLSLLLKVGESSNTKFIYDEVLNFENIAFDNETVFGFLSNQTSSINLKKFIDKNNKYNYSCNLIYGTDQSYLILRSNNKNSEFNSSYFTKDNLNEYKKVYEHFSWNTKKRDYEILYDTSEGYDENKIEILIKEIQKGRKVKIHFKYEKYNYILSPYMNYNSQNKDGTKFVSSKILPISLLPTKFEDIKKINEVETFINTEGSINFLQTKNYKLKNSNKSNFWKKFLVQLKNLIPKKYYQSTFRIDTKWYLEK